MAGSPGYDPRKTQYLFVSRMRSVDELVARMRADARAVESDDPIHYPPDHDFLLNFDDDHEGRIRVRHYATGNWASPILELQVSELPNGIAIACEVLHRESPFSAKSRARAAEGALADWSTPDLIGLVCKFLWNALVWNLWLDPLLQRNAMKRYGAKLLAFVKDLAESDGIPARTEPADSAERLPAAS